MKIVARGAEAVLYKDGSNLIKERIKKGYRHEKLDNLIRKSCCRRESKLLEKSHSLIKVPKVIKSDEREMKIVMEFIDGDRVKDVLHKVDRKKVCIEIGKNIAKLHTNDIIHGDLTTSNMILREKDVYFIDFGLGFVSKKVEDKAVDLRLLRQAFESKHYQYPECFSYVLSGYNSDGCSEVVKRLDVVESRGRYKKKSQQ